MYKSGSAQPYCEEEGVSSQVKDTISASIFSMDLLIYTVRIYIFVARC